MKAFDSSADSREALEQTDILAAELAETEIDKLRKLCGEAAELLETHYVTDPGGCENAYVDVLAARLKGAAR